jgi:hypothetical protein
MNITFVILLIVFLMFEGLSCGRSKDESRVESKAKEEVKSLGKEATGEVKELEKDYKVLEGEKDYRKALEKEPKAPPDAIKEPMGGKGFEERDVSPPE